MYRIPLGWQEAKGKFGAAQNTAECQGVPTAAFFHRMCLRLRTWEPGCPQDSQPGQAAQCCPR